MARLTTTPQRRRARNVLDRNVLGRNKPARSVLVRSVFAQSALERPALRPSFRRQSALLFGLLALAMSAVGLPRIARAYETRGLDIAGWLAMPGTSHLAVTFYSREQPEASSVLEAWTRAQDSFHRLGARIIFVVPGAPYRGCEAFDEVPWHPDAIVCDEFGVIARSFRLGGLPDLVRPTTPHPVTFLWSWPGRLIGTVEGDHIEDLEPLLERDRASRPKLEVASPIVFGPPGTPDALRLRSTLEALLKEQEKFDVVEAPRETASRADTSHADTSHVWTPRADTSRASTPRSCDVSDIFDRSRGANLRLVSALEPRDGEMHLSAHLERSDGCRIASAERAWDRMRPRNVLADTVNALIERAMPVPELPRPSNDISTFDSLRGGDGDRTQDREASLHRLAQLDDSPVPSRLLVHFARTVVGAAYRRCGRTPQSFDYVSFVRYAFSSVFSVDIGPTPMGMWRQGVEVDLVRGDPDRFLRPWDVIFMFSEGGFPEWTAIYLGRGLILGAVLIRGVQVLPLPPFDSRLGRLGVRRYLRERDEDLSAPTLEAAEMLIEGVGLPPRRGWPADEGWPDSVLAPCDDDE